MSDYFDELETRDPQRREAALFERLPDFLAGAIAAAPGWRRRLSDVDPREVTSRAALAELPVLRKPELMEAQAAEPPFGGLADPASLDGNRIFMSPGPVWEPQPSGSDAWQGARAFFAAGIRKGDLVHNALSYHMTPGGFILDEGARALGARVFPGGVGNTEQQVEAAAFLKPDAYAGTPDYLKVMLDKAAEMGRDLSSIRKALVSGGALFPSMRADYAERGVAVMQAYATADLGVIAYESALAGEPLPGMIVNETMIVEIVRPGTGDPVPAGEVGELVVTSFNPAYPLIRFGTGDLSAVLDEPSPCGRTNMRIKGWMGRADQRTKVKGMFVDPKQVDAVVKSVPGVGRARLVVDRVGDSDAMTLMIAPMPGAAPDLQALNAALHAQTKLNGTVEIAADLPNDGKVIDDRRDYSK
ncbi:AMP-binding protein [Oricola sp.]|uniref:phenylacetate--CoA ligase family protein n=1 Tax=Oricola sp. TaxID=1979950 RepID=UPI0025F24B98|nr:AMP-binding protein [Oricola sp.]MCI5074811.1 AMP-binding protein [Oricola sp.]